MHGPAGHDTDKGAHEAHADEEEDDGEGLLDGRAGVEVCSGCSYMVSQKWGSIDTTAPPRAHMYTYNIHI